MTDSERIREHLLDEAVKAGKFSAARKPHYRRLFNARPKATRALIARLAAGLPSNATGQSARDADDASYPRHWLTGERPEGPLAAQADAAVGAAPTVHLPVAHAPGDDSYPAEWLAGSSASAAGPPPRVVFDGEPAPTDRPRVVFGP